MTESKGQKLKHVDHVEKCMISSATKSERRVCMKIRRVNLFPVLLCTLGSLLLSTHTANGHISAFISSEGKPNLAPRPIRGPTVPTVPFHPDIGYSSTEMLRLPGLSFGPGHRRQMYLRNINDHSLTSVSNGDSPNDLYLDTAGGEDKPTFVPYIGPRALTSVNEYLRHLRDNLEALQSSEEYSDDDGDYDIDIDDSMNMQFPDLDEFHEEKQHTRRHAIIPETGGKVADHPGVIGAQAWPLLSDGHNHNPNTRRFVDPPASLPQTFVLRRASNTYNPSWSYTRLGLGKRKRSIRTQKQTQQ